MIVRRFPLVCLLFASSLLLLGVVPAGAEEEAPSSTTRLWYTRPAAKWVEALPIGNGRLGAMVYGGIEHEQLQFNGDTLWTGKPHEYQHPGAAEHLAAIRQLLADGKQHEAEQLAMREFMS